MNNRGNILIIGIVLLNILCIIGNIFTSDFNQILIFNKMDINNEVIKIKTIQKIEDEFKNDCKDFELNENGIHVIASYDGTDYLVEVNGNTNYEMVISYDFIFECIENIEYIYE